MNLHNIRPGGKLSFAGFRGERPAIAAFAEEVYDDGAWRVVGVHHIPIRYRPRTPEGRRVTIRWARNRLARAMAV